MDNLFELFIGGLVLLFWLFGGKRRSLNAKKSAPPRRVPSRSAPTATVESRDPARFPQDPVATSAPTARLPDAEKLQELGELLGLDWAGQVERVEDAATAGEPPSPPSPEARGDASPAPRTSGRPLPPPPRPPPAWVDTPPPEVTRAPFSSALRTPLTPRSMQEAVILREILGPPKALEP